MKGTRFNIEVTEKDITKAHKNDSYKCVVSQAIARKIPDAVRIETDSQTIRFTRQGVRLIFLTPYAVQGYVIAFDAGDKIEPFSFQLRNPQHTKMKRRTALGKAVNRAASAARKKVRKANPEATVEDVRAAAKAAYAEAREVFGDGPVESASGRKPPPRVFKRKQRSYGHRLLRINRAPQGTTGEAGQ